MDNLKINKIDLAYIAGFFDGDGCVTISERRNRGDYSISARITSTNQPIIRWLHEIFGGYTAPNREPKNSGRKQRPAWIWGVDRRKALRFYESVYPYLRIKKKEAELAIGLQKLITSRGGTSRPLTEGEKAERRVYRENLKEARRAR